MQRRRQWTRERVEVLNEARPKDTKGENVNKPIQFNILAPGLILQTTVLKHNPAIEVAVMRRSAAHVDSWIWGDLPLAKGGISAPEADGQSNHKESMGSEVGGDRKATIESRSSQLLLHPGKTGRLPAEQG